MSGNNFGSSPVVLPPALAALHHELQLPPGYAAERGLALHPEALEKDLVTIGLNDDRPIRLTVAAAAAWTRMRDAAALTSVTLLPISGFRSVARQAEIIRGKLGAGQPLGDILRLVAAPGFSEHHTGRAVDIASPEHIDLDEEFARTDAFRWLELHAGRFGFHLSYPRSNGNGIGFEPWHWCWQEEPPPVT